MSGQSAEIDAPVSWTEWGVRRTWGPQIGSVATFERDRRTAEKCAREWPGELVSRIVEPSPWMTSPTPPGKGDADA